MVTGIPAGKYTSATLPLITADAIASVLSKNDTSVPKVMSKARECLWDEEMMNMDDKDTHCY